MSYSEFIDFLNGSGVPRTDADGGEVALRKEDALKALKLLAETDIAILGGDVYELQVDGYFRPTYDNWYCNREDIPLPLFAERSRETALIYLNNYNEAEGVDIRYVLVIDV